MEVRLAVEVRTGCGSVITNRAIKSTCERGLLLSLGHCLVSSIRGMFITTQGSVYLHMGEYTSLLKK